MEGDTVWVSDKKQQSNFLIFLKKYAIIIIDIIIALIIATILIVRALKSSTLDILIAPTTATVKINGEVYPSSGSFNFFPGTYEVEISADNFETQKYTLNLEKDSIQKLYTYLTGENGDLSVYNTLDSQETYLLRTLDNNQDKDLSEYLEKSDEYFDFIASLPYGYSDDNGVLCSIGVNFQNNKNLIVTKVYECTPEIVESWIKSKGLDPNYFSITYQDLPEENYDE